MGICRLRKLIKIRFCPDNLFVCFLVYEYNIFKPIELSLYKLSFLSIYVLDSEQEVIYFRIID